MSVWGSTPDGTVGYKRLNHTLADHQVQMYDRLAGAWQNVIGAFEAALNYSKERHQFNKPISSFQSISFKLADMATKIEAAKLLIHQVADLKNKGLPMTKESAMAKLYASQVAMDTTIEAVQIHGGYGFVKEFHVERLMRDAKITQIYEGTSEIQRIVISRELLK